MKTPIRLISLTLRNFLSYGNNYTTLDLTFSDPTLVVGRNLDAMVNGQIDSNGAGKTALINALSWSLYDKTISEIKKDRLINYINKKNMEVILIFEKNGKFYKIHRYRKHKALGGDGVRMYESDTLNFSTDDTKEKDDDIAVDSMSRINDQIVSIVDMPFEIFSRIVIYSASHRPFFSLPVTSTKDVSQSSIIEELCGLTELTAKADVLKEDIKIDKKELESLLKIEEEIVKQRDGYNTQIASIQSRINIWEKNKSEMITALKIKLEKLSDIDFDLQKILFEEKKESTEILREIETNLKLKTNEMKQVQRTLNDKETFEQDRENKLQSLKLDLNKFSNVDFAQQLSLLEQLDELKNKRRDIKTNNKVHESTLIDSSKKYANVCDQLEHLKDNKCPFCLQAFKDTEEKTRQLVEEQAFEYSSMNEMQKLLKIAASEVETIDEQMQTIQAQLQYDSKGVLERDKKKYSDAQMNIKFVEDQINPYENTNIVDIENQLSILNNEISNFEKSKTKIEKKLSKINNELLYNSESDLISDSHKIGQLKNDLEKEEQSENPHTETLEDMKKIEINDSNSKKIDEIEKSILHKNFLHKLLTKPDSFIRKSLLNQSLPFLNKQLKHYLDNLGLPHKVEFTEKLTASISQFGNELDYDNLSSGQKARVNLALSFAFRDVLQKRYGKISFCILDECLDVGLGGTGVQMAAKMIRKIAKDDKLSMLVISHRDEVAAMFDQILEIELSKGFSKIIDSKISSTTE